MSRTATFTKGVKRSGQTWWSHLFQTRLKNYMPKRRKPRPSDFTERDAILKKAGFLKFERDWLVMGTLNTKNMQRVIEIRRRRYAEARVTFDSRNEYVADIIAMYETNGWKFKSRRHILGKWNPFDMVEAIRRIEDNPDTPQRKKRKHTHKASDYMTYKANTPKRQSQRRRYYMHEGEA